MTTQEAYDRGAASFHSGLRATPCLDVVFINSLESGLPFSAETGKETIRLLDAWNAGWTRANLDAPY